MTREIILVGVGGGIGSILRFATSVLTAKFVNSIFPYATFLVNILGCLLIGILLGLLDKHQFTNNDLKFLFITGFCGGFTTFSTFASENIGLIQSNQIATAIIYIGASVIISLFAVWLGLILVK